jgi:hypothetical protein
VAGAAPLSSSAAAPLLRCPTMTYTIEDQAHDDTQRYCWNCDHGGIRTPGLDRY